MACSRQLASCHAWRYHRGNRNSFLWGLAL